MPCFALLSVEVSGGSACDIDSALPLKALRLREAVLYGIRTTIRVFLAIDKTQCCGYQGRGARIFRY